MAKITDYRLSPDALVMVAGSSVGTQKNFMSMDTGTSKTALDMKARRNIYPLSFSPVPISTGMSHMSSVPLTVLPAAAARIFWRKERHTSACRGYTTPIMAASCRSGFV